MRKHKSINEAIMPDDIDLSSFDLKTKLNPKFWQNDILNKRIRRALLLIAKDFISELPLELNIIDIIFTGSLANYNWDKTYSDIDLHIVIDYNDIDINIDILTTLFKDAKTIWNTQHTDLTIAGYPVEVYVQDSNEPHASTGVYSILHNKWVKKPQLKLIQNKNLNTNTVKSKVAKYCNLIDELESKFNDEFDSDILSELYDNAKLIFKKIKNERSSGVNTKKAELSTGNVIFKTLRRNGYIEKLLRLRTMCYDRLHSFY